MKKFVLAILALLMLCLLTGCSNQTGTPAESTLDVPLMELVTKHFPDAEGMIRFSAMDLEDIIGIEASEYTDAVYLQDADISGGEAVVLRAVDAQTAKSIAERLENYLEQRRNETKNYFPESYKLLKETKVQRKNNTVALIVAEKAAEITNRLLAGE